MPNERQRKDSWPPSANATLRWVGGLLGVIAATLSTWFLADWMEGRALLAHANATAERAEAKTYKNGDAIKQVERRAHKVDLTLERVGAALDRLTDMAAKHDEEIDELNRRRRR